MRWDFGKVYKDIRKSKGLTQEAVCGQTVARSTLANFERGTSTPKFETMIFLLDQIDMSVEEFRYICHEYHPSEKQSILYDVQHLPPYPKLTDFEQLLERCQLYLTKHPDIPIQRLSHMLTVYIHLYKGETIDNSAVLQQITKTIWKDLEKQDTWYESDLRLLRSVLYHFPVDALQAVTEKILERIEKYRDYRRIQPFQIALLVNLANLYFLADKRTECERILPIIIDLSLEIKHYIHLATSYVRLGICRGDDDLIEKGLALLRLTDEDKLAKVLEAEVKKYS